MSKVDDFEVLRKIIVENPNPLSTKELLGNAERLEMPFEYPDLINYWRRGLLYISQVQLTEAGYFPHPEGTWLAHQSLGYFGFETTLGVFQINEDTPNPMKATLEATISVSDPILSLAIHPNRKQFAIGCRSGMIALCDLDHGRIIKKLRGSESRAWALVYSPSGGSLLSGHQNGKLIKWTDVGELSSEVQT